MRPSVRAEGAPWASLHRGRRQAMRETGMYEAGITSSYAECATLSVTESTQRRIFAAEALDYLRQLAVRDALTSKAAKQVRSFIARNATRPPVKFTRPPGAFVM